MDSKECQKKLEQYLSFRFDRGGIYYLYATKVGNTFVENISF